MACINWQPVVDHDNKVAMQGAAQFLLGWVTVCL